MIDQPEAIETDEEIAERVALIKVDSRIAELWKLGIALDRLSEKQIMRKMDETHKTPKGVSKNLSMLYALYFRQAGVSFLVEAANQGWSYRYFLEELFDDQD